MASETNYPSFWVPNVNVLVNAAGELVIKAELAGISNDDFEIVIEGQTLTLAGQRADPDGRGAKYLVLEMHHGRFESVLEVPKEFDLSRARNTYQNGLLRFVAPRRT